ncbi:MAG: transposase [Ascidiaceihabitans sp.]|uniref:transposase n=1 Tax=Ascidiaceihabitans sp. TaxID=1872644 RepID=UPI003298EEA2
MKHGFFEGLVRPMIEMDDVLAHAINPLLAALTVLFQHDLQLDRYVKRAAFQGKLCMRMMTIPGVGPAASLTFKAAVDDPNRFKRSRTVGADFGLAPRRF